MTRRTFLAMIVAMSVGLVFLRPLHADGTVPGSTPATAPTWDPWTFDYILRLFGADVGVGYRGLSLVPGYQTTLWAYVGGGYEGEHLYRDPTGAIPSPDSLSSSADPSFNRIEGAWRLGIEQGLAWNPRISENLLETFLFYRGRYDLNTAASGSLLAQAPLSVLPDRDASLLNTLQLGFAYNDLNTNGHRVRDGVLAETTAEWGPSFLGNTIQGDSDFIRFNANLTWFAPLYDAAPDRRLNLFSVYVGDFLSADYAVGLNGTQVPLYVRQTFGGRTQDTALGAQVRGVDKGAYDTNLKAVNNLEVRVNLPAIPSQGIAAAILPRVLSDLVPNVVPGVLAYVDTGLYDQVGEPGITAPASGFVASTGAGLYAEVPGFGSVLAYFEYRLDHANSQGDRLRLFVLEFGMQF
ncbi:MAG TPA: BamA/TamA family outer membrane protein [Spirochaetia bacterium]|nr:BamA/TamA family outer membrane protein [Spirochaetia bacterium]